MATDRESPPNGGFDAVTSWCASCSHCLGETYDLCAPYLANDTTFLPPLVRFVSAQLLISCHLSSESVFLLVLNQKPWDADTLLRSVLEGTFKFAYILDGDPQSRAQKAEEYWVVLPEMARITRHQRASQLLRSFKDDAIALRRPIADLIISPEEECALRGRHPKAERQRLNRKWAFLEIAKHFGGHPDCRHHGMAALAYSYGLQSHLLHQDGDGVGMIWDRSRRGPERRVAIEWAHAGRLVSDLCHFGFFRAAQLLAAVNKPDDTVKELTRKYQSLFDDIDHMGQVWHHIEYETPKAPLDRRGRS